MDKKMLCVVRCHIFNYISMLMSFTLSVMTNVFLGKRDSYILLKRNN